MSLKKKFEGISTSPRWRNTAYKNAIRSLNPKTTTKKLEGETQQDTQFLSTLVGKGSHFKEIDAYAQQKKYFEYVYFPIIYLLIFMIYYLFVYSYILIFKIIK